MSDHVHSHADLTKNQSLVMGALSNAEGPLSAYTILDQLRSYGFRAPLQVYRALDSLLDAGLVHRLGSLNAFVACRQDECADSGQTVFMICEGCSKVSEITDTVLSKRLKSVAEGAQFALKKATIELRGTCQSCTAA